MGHEEEEERPSGCTLGVGWEVNTKVSVRPCSCVAALSLDVSVCVAENGEGGGVRIPEISTGLARGGGHYAS